MRRTILFLLLILAFSSQAAAYSATTVWSDPKYAKVYARSTTSDSFSMNHTYYATVKLKTPHRTATMSSTSMAGFVNASTSLPIQKMDLGAYVGSGTHMIYCPYNLWDVQATTPGSANQGVTTGVSVTCYHFVPATCTYVNSKDMVGTYLRIDLEPPFADCWVACVGPRTTQIKQWPTDNACRERKARYNYFSLSAAGIINCFKDDPNAVWYG